MLALVDLVVPARHVVGTTARLAWERGPLLWAVVAMVGAGPAVLAVLG
jgi:hypothetical protein